MANPACLDCTYAEFGFPCQAHGVFDADRFAREYVESIRDKDDPCDESHWSFDCMEEVVRPDPELAWQVIRNCIDHLTTPWQATMIAAGPLENLIADHGEVVIDRIEDMARRSPRFRYVLNGVWPLGNGHTDIWRRVEVARCRRRGQCWDEGQPLPDKD